MKRLLRKLRYRGEKLNLKKHLVKEIDRLTQELQQLQRIVQEQKAQVSKATQIAENAEFEK